jgi:hypothetical protein
MCFHIHFLAMQPDNPRELSSKIYEMMGTTFAGKWANGPPEVEPSQPCPLPQTQHSETAEAEVVETVKVGQQN